MTIFYLCDPAKNTSCRGAKIGSCGECRRTKSRASAKRFLGIPIISIRAMLIWLKVKKQLRLAQAIYRDFNYHRIVGMTIKELARELVFRSYNSDDDVYYPDDGLGGTYSFGRAVQREIKWLESANVCPTLAGERRLIKRKVRYAIGPSAESARAATHAMNDLVRETEKAAIAMEYLADLTKEAIKQQE